jgi:lysyl-tRNA synthetase class 2
MNFTEELFKDLLTKVNGSLKLTYQGTEISFEGQWPRYSFRELILKDCGIDIDDFGTKEELMKEIDRKGIRFETDVEITSAGRGTLIDLLYKKVSRPQLINPTFITHHPLDLSPLPVKMMKTLGGGPLSVVVNGWKCKCVF